MPDDMLVLLPETILRSSELRAETGRDEVEGCRFNVVSGGRGLTGGFGKRSGVGVRSRIPGASSCCEEDLAVAAVAAAEVEEIARLCGLDGAGNVVASSTGAVSSSP